MKYDGVIMSPGGEAVAVWIPPGVPEMDEADEASLMAGTQTLFGGRAPLLFEVYEMFAQARPAAPQNWCLSLLATNPEHRGKGAGMQLVEDFLVRVDAEQMPAYLESTNAANLARYGGAGFEQFGQFTAPQGPTVTTMWRPPVRRS
jgi:GNAT superfamily N-acetyltransferase